MPEYAKFFRSGIISIMSSRQNTAKCMNGVATVVTLLALWQAVSSLQTRALVPPSPALQGRNNSNNEELKSLISSLTSNRQEPDPSLPKDEMKDSLLEAHRKICAAKAVLDFLDNNFAHLNSGKAIRLVDLVTKTNDASAVVGIAGLEELREVLNVVQEAYNVSMNTLFGVFGEMSPLSEEYASLKLGKYAQTLASSARDLAYTAYGIAEPDTYPEFAAGSNQLRSLIQDQLEVFPHALTLSDLNAPVDS